MSRLHETLRRLHRLAGLLLVLALLALVLGMAAIAESRWGVAVPMVPEAPDGVVPLTAAVGAAAVVLALLRRGLGALLGRREPAVRTDMADPTARGPADLLDGVDREEDDPYAATVADRPAWTVGSGGEEQVEGRANESLPPAERNYARLRTAVATVAVLTGVPTAGVYTAATLAAPAGSPVTVAGELLLDGMGALFGGFLPALATTVALLAVAVGLALRAAEGLAGALVVGAGMIVTGILLEAVGLLFGGMAVAYFAATARGTTEPLVLDVWPLRGWF